jgi:hypothetical protein
MKPAKWISAALAAVAAAILPACDNFVITEIRPGVTRAEEVQARMGPPGFEFRNADGTVTWEYTRQPAGFACYMITLDGDRIVQKVEQVLSEPYYAQAIEGMSREQVRRLFGKPARVEVFDNLREEVWEWRIEGTPHNEETYLNAHFDTGTGLLKKAGKRVAMKG